MWCKQFENNRRCDNFCLFIVFPISIEGFKDEINSDSRGWIG